MEEGVKRTGWAPTDSAASAAALATGDGASLGIPPTTSDALRLTKGERDRFLRVVSQNARIGSHLELFKLLQGDVQHFIPHQILICAWGNFFGSNLRLDVISAIPGVRTGLLSGCNVEKLLKNLYSRWLTHKRRPLLLDIATLELQGFSRCDCALHRSLQGMRSVLVHGIHDARNGADSLNFAAHVEPIVTDNRVERFALLVDQMIAQIDVAFRRVACIELSGLATDPNSQVLSSREEEILTRVSEGYTNAEIAKILGISMFTVKNHVRRIIKKLGAANRTEAVAMCRQLAPDSRHLIGPRATAIARKSETALGAE